MHILFCSLYLRAIYELHDINKSLLGRPVTMELLIACGVDT